MADSEHTVSARARESDAVINATRLQRRTTASSQATLRLWQTGPHWRVDIDPSYENTLSRERFGTYQSFISAPGRILKEEDRTIITRVDGAAEAKGGESPSFVIKHYLYPPRSQMRTWHRWSKAHREFAALSYVRRLGVPALEPIACGVKRTRLGSVASCFLVTRYVHGCICLRDYLRDNSTLSSEKTQAIEGLMRELGHHIRSVHARGFYLSRLSAKNILVRHSSETKFDWFLADQPYARHLKPRSLSRAGQMRDLGSLESSFRRHGLVDALAQFYSTYLPDPLGASEQRLRNRALRGVSIHENRTLLRRLMKQVKRHRTVSTDGAAEPQPESLSREALTDEGE